MRFLKVKIKKCAKEKKLSLCSFVNKNRAQKKIKIILLNFTHSKPITNV